MKFDRETGEGKLTLAEIARGVVIGATGLTGAAALGLLQILGSAAGAEASRQGFLTLKEQLTLASVPVGILVLGTLRTFADNPLVSQIFDAIK
ncbi:hypothetical protein A2397_04775 [Candidatus Amesbacteria bacterium RIFOXYB1_FULL_44_23]|uniref:Uncharacterized protein n=1 Tax=Candidatus Amesbacteria bacterium RIFOXYB1_FULL_44_23 TaxID=1797263 RepID=A0A1F4ZWT3_9BACT|nr:MAG: hypothetical protein A2397_04775 [Candidatus Amesbacteria bacterium RIFOXYB1_FULL_44_23]